MDPRNNMPARRETAGGFGSTRNVENFKMSLIDELGYLGI
jgi:hypothetical protein